MNSFLLDITGILFAAQLVTLLVIGPYADYGTWRPWIMIGMPHIPHFALEDELADPFQSLKVLCT